MNTEPLNDDVDVCVDCYADHHEGRAMKDGSVSWTDNTQGDDPEGDPEGVTDFSWSPCGCCGSTLGGSRYRMAIWPLPEEEGYIRAENEESTDDTGN